MNVGGARQAWIGVGSNLQGTWGASPDRQVAAAMQAIDRLPGTRALAQSSLYRSPPMGPSDQPDYANAVMRIQTRLAPATLLRLLKRLDKPRKRWKFDKSDIDGWEKRRQYEAFAEEALAETHTEQSPWFIVPGDRKPQARAIVAAILAEQLQRLAPDYPKEDETVLKEYRRLLAKNGVK